jgi:hypothetical protein
LIELSPIQSSVKKKLLEMLNPTDPESQQKQQMMEQIQIQQAQADVADKMASAKMKEAQAIKALNEANAPPEQQMGDDPMKVQAEVMETQAKIAKTEAEIEKIRADTAKVQLEMQLEPVRMQMEQKNKEREMEFNAQSTAQEHGIRERDSERKFAIDGAVASQANKASQETTSQNENVGKALVQAAEKTAKSLEKASQSMAEVAQSVVKAATAKRTLVRDPKTGRATGSEVVG